MRGFTLIETLVYIGVSTLIGVSLISFVFILLESQSVIGEKSREDFAGLYVLRMVENQIRNHQSISLENLTSKPITNITISDDKPLKTVSFSINHQVFSISLYEP